MEYIVIYKDIKKKNYKVVRQFIDYLQAYNFLTTEIAEAKKRGVVMEGLILEVKQVLVSY